MKDNIFSEQYFILKFLLISLGLVYSFMLKTNIIIYLIIVNIVFFLFGYKLLLEWFNVLKKMALFFISYLVFALIFDIDYSVQMSFLIRMAYLLQLSVYLTRSSSMRNVLYDLRFFLKNSCFYRLFYFLIALNTSFFIFNNLWHNELADQRKHGIKISNIGAIVVKVIEDGFAKLFVVKYLVNRALHSQYETERAIISYANLLLAYQFAIYILAASL